MMEPLEAATELIPSMNSTGIKSFIHGPDTHSPDHYPIMGPGT